jgi:hypothetical protein
MGFLMAAYYALESGTPPAIQRCLDKGRALQELLFEAAPRYVQALKREKCKSASKQIGMRIGAAK